MKKFIVIKTFLVLTLLAVVFTACGKKEEKKVEETKKTVESETAKEEKKVDEKKEKIKTYAKDKNSSYNIIKFGSYPQSVSGDVSDIEWLVLDKNDDYTLLLSRYVLDCKNYNDEKAAVTYEKSSIRKWLNNDFVKKAFSDSDLQSFGNINVFGFGLIRGDNVALLSEALCEKYFGNENSKKVNMRLATKATDYAIKNGVEVDNNKNLDTYKCASFYLSDNVEGADKALWVGQYGHIYTDGQPVKLENGDGVRPIICLRNDAFANSAIDDINANEVMEKSGNYSFSNVSKATYQSMSVPLSEKNVIDLKAWNYGMTPIEWVYVAPNTQIISNNKPNTSPKFAYKRQVSSGEKGCYIPIFSRCESIGSDYDGRFYCFEDYTKKKPEEMTFSNKFADLMYGDYNVKDLLAKKYELTELTESVVMADDVYINVIYVTDLDKIIEENKGNAD